MSVVRPALLLLAVLFVQACATPLGEQAALEQYVAGQKAAARQAREDGQLARSLALWRSLEPLDAADPDTRRAITELESLIEAQVLELLHSGRVAYARGSSRQGDTDMLRVLALNPGDQRALAPLAESVSARAQRQQREKSEGEYQVAVAPASAAPIAGTSTQLQALYDAGDYRAMLDLAAAEDLHGEADARLLRSAHTALADEAENRGALDEALAHMQQAMLLQPRENDPLVQRSALMRRELSVDWYRRGSRLINKDLDSAVAALQKSLDYNPYNDNARRKLDQARTLQRNLQKIEGRR